MTHHYHLGIWIYEKIAKSRFGSRSQIWTQIWPPENLPSDYSAARVQIWDLDSNGTTLKWKHHLLNDGLLDKGIQMPLC